jgi:hypothetical protein
LLDLGIDGRIILKSCIRCNNVDNYSGCRQVMNSVRLALNAVMKLKTSQKAGNFMTAE